MADINFDPAGAMDEVMSLFGAQKEAVATRLESLDSIEEQHSASTNKELEAILEEARLSGMITSAKNQLVLNRAQRNKETAAFFGLNPEASNSIIAEMAQTISSEHRQVVASAQSLAARQQKSFMDNPIDWIYEQFALPQDIAAHNTRAQILDQNITVMEKLGDLADKQIARNNAIDANTTVALAGMEAERALVIATKNAENARQQALAFGVQLGSVRLAATQQDFSHMLQVHQFGASLQHLQLARAAREDQTEMRALQREQLELLIQKKEEDAEARDSLQKQLDRATGILGMRRVTVQEYDRAPQGTKSALFDVMANPSVNEGRLGYDAIDAVETAHKVNAPLTPALTEVKNAITTWSAEAASKATFAALKSDQKHLEMQKVVEAKVKDQLNNIPDAGGLYSAPSLKAVGQIPAVSSTILWKSVFEPQAAARPQTSTSAQAVYDAAVGLVIGGQMPLDRAAAEVAQIYNAIAIDNTQQRDYNRFALPVQDTYRTTLRAGPQFYASDPKIIDMTKEIQVKQMILRGVAAGKMEQSGQVLPLPPVTNAPRVK